MSIARLKELIAGYDKGDRILQRDPINCFVSNCDMNRVTIYRLNIIKYLLEYIIYIV